MYRWMKWSDRVSKPWHCRRLDVRSGQPKDSLSSLLDRSGFGASDELRAPLSSNLMCILPPKTTPTSLYYEFFLNFFAPAKQRNGFATLANKESSLCGKWRRWYYFYMILWYYTIIMTLYYLNICFYSVIIFVSYPLFFSKTYTYNLRIFLQGMLYYHYDTI